MRAVGIVERPRGDVGSHTCSCFDDDAAFNATAAAFLADGQRRGERLLFISEAPPETAIDALAALEARHLVDSGALVVVSTSDLYDAGAGFNGQAQLDRFRYLLGAALDDGFTGMRVAADTSVLVTGTESAYREFVEYELAVDRFIATSPLATMCAYRRDAVGDRLADLLAVHPTCHGVERPLQARVYYDHDVLHVSGELDCNTTALVDVVIAELERDERATATVDMSALTFVDVRTMTRLAVLAEELSRSGRRLAIVQPPSWVDRICSVLDLDDLTEAMVTP